MREEGSGRTEKLSEIYKNYILKLMLIHLLIPQTELP